MGIGENVFGLINMALDDVQADLEREHYEVRKFVLPAVAVDARHRRDRVFIIAYRDPSLGDSQHHGSSPTKVSRVFAASSDNDEERQKSAIEPQRASRSKYDANVGDRGEQVSHVADTHGEGELQQEGLEHEVRRWSGDGGKESESMAYATDAGLQRRTLGGDLESEGQIAIEQSSRFGDLRRGREWSVEPRVGRVANGIPNRVDRIKGLGNAVVPQLIQAIGELVLAADKEIYDVS